MHCPSSNSTTSFQAKIHARENSQQAGFLHHKKCERCSPIGSVGFIGLVQMGLPIARYFLAAGVALRVHTERPRKPLSRQNCRTEIWSESLKASPFHGIHADRPVEGNG